MIPNIETYRSVITGIKLSVFYLCTLVSVFCAGSIQVSAQDALIRTVVISSEDGSPMVGANVLIYSTGQNSELLYNCVTNPTGFCEIRGITPETEFELRISYVGFAAHAERFVLEPDERRTIRVELETEVGALEDEAVVIGDRMVTTGRAGVQRVSSDDIARIPTPGVDGDLVSFLQTEPGIVTTGDRGGDLYIRGGTPDQNLVLVDNLPVVKPFHVSNLFSAFSEEVVQNADVYAGGHGAEFSNAMSAVIDISLRPGNFRQYSGSGAVSPY
ncbi:MAG TPA: carboxypeptidase regulatory-like domain-containing protein, partial [Gracilimonas sp.]|nr:carboxypeptidase regulatory-like domain-containing protein [Gracilimonas sp.]